MKIRNLKYVFKIKYGQRFYEKKEGKGLLIIPKIISYLTKKRLKVKKDIFVVFDSLNPVNQCTHPDLIRTNKCGDKLILTVSGYPFNIARFENPYVFVSNDGIHFSNPLGKEAVVTYKGKGSSHYSDSEIVEDNGLFYLFYRMCYEEKDNQRIVIYANSSSNLSEWNNEIEVFSKAGRVYLSPSIIKTETKYHMYYVDCIDLNSGKYALMRKIAHDVLFRDVISTEKLTIINQPEGQEIWHIDVIPEGDRLLGLFTFTMGDAAAKTRLYYSQSDDYGKTWKIGQEVKFDINMKIVKRVYRSTMIKNDKGFWNIYYAVCTNNNCWFLICSKDCIVPEIK